MTYKITVCNFPLFFYLIFIFCIPFNLFAWRGCESNVAGSFGLSNFNDLIINSTNNSKVDLDGNSNVDLNFDSGLAWIIRVGYSLSDYVSFDLQVLFTGLKTDSNYFSPQKGDRLIADNGSIASIFNSKSSSKDGEQIRMNMILFNMLIFFDSGFNLVPLVSFGAGPIFNSFSGYRGTVGTGYKFSFGADLLLYPKLSIFAMISRTYSSDIVFSTRHQVVVKDEILDRFKYVEEKHQDTLKEFQWNCFEVGLRFGF